MATDEELGEYLCEHYAYELKMARHTCRKIASEEDQLNWNAYFEAFWIHARSLRDFYTDDKAKNNMNIKISDYVPARVAEKAEYQGIFNKIDQQIAHLSKNRTLSDNERRLSLDDVLAVVPWLDGKHGQFIAKCDPKQKVGWDEKLAQPPTNTSMLYGATPSATNRITVTSSPTSFVSTYLFTPTKGEK